MLFGGIAMDLVLSMPDAMHVFLTVWLFSVGCCVGSFLNVVVLRLPAGIDISRSGSRCPRCMHPIRWYDNVPLISWLVLRGRCRDCGVHISIRYPLSEVLMGVVFVVLAFAEGFTDGHNLPVPSGAERYYYMTVFQVWSIYTYHIVLLGSLISAAMIAGDGHRVPLRLLAPALIIGLVGPVVLPHLHPVPLHSGLVVDDRIAALATGVFGLVTGCAVGLIAVTGGTRDRLRDGYWQTRAAACGICGLFLGWQAGLVLVAVTLVAWLVLRSVARMAHVRHPIPWYGVLSLTSIVYITCWRVLVQRFPICGPGGTLVDSALIILFVLGLAALVSRLRPRLLHPTISVGQGDSMPLNDPEKNLQAIEQSPSYRMVEEDPDFLRRSEVRPVRLQLELLKPEILFAEHGVESTIVVFGGTQIVEQSKAEQNLKTAEANLAEAPDDPVRQRVAQRAKRIVDKSHYYDAARAFSRIVSARCQVDGQCDYVIITGGGPGIMEAANRGAYDVESKSIGLNITLPQEQTPNPYITPELCFQFHYFALRKMHFLMRAKALVVFPGGFGTLDELFDALTLRQTNRMQEIPIILFGKQYWQQVIDFQFLADEGVVQDSHLKLFSYADTAEQAWETICTYHEKKK